MKIKPFSLMALFACLSFWAMAQKPSYPSYEHYPLPKGDLVEMRYQRSHTQFQLWAPTATSVQLRLYAHGSEGKPTRTLRMKPSSDGCWRLTVRGNLEGQYYTYEVEHEGKLLGETPGINARAVGLNGRRAAIIDLRTTDPEGWKDDKAPTQNDIVIYEMHHRDFSIHPSSGVQHRGKYLALTQSGSHTLDSLPTGLDHLKDLGVTHVHLLPSYDYASIDEAKHREPHYNWGYDPLNYNVPEGSYSTDPADPKSRIREFKQMVQALHKAGLRVVLDVVYNHTYDIAGSNFERTVPGYFFRTRPDGTPANASGCGNETASERAVMRRYMVESVEYWLREYHVDGFRFDLMGIHDLETMRQIRAAAQRIRPEVLIYGEGWAAEAPQLPADQLAMKANVHQLEGIAAFSDELRDGLRGPFSDDKQTAFLGGLEGHEESIKYGIVGGIAHPQVDCSKVNYTRKPWASQPQQLISYVSCHDDMCLHDRLRSSIPHATEQQLRELALLAQTAVFTSQGIPFMQAGEELCRTKLMVHNSYNQPDSINQIDWSTKAQYLPDYRYYRELITLRREHPAFRLRSAELVRRHLEFLAAPAGVVAYRLKDHAGGDQWKDIVVVLNGTSSTQTIELPPHDYQLYMSSHFRPDLEGDPAHLHGSLRVPKQCALVLFCE